MIKDLSEEFYITNNVIIVLIIIGWLTTVTLRNCPSFCTYDTGQTIGYAEVDRPINTFGYNYMCGGVNICLF